VVVEKFLKIINSIRNNAFPEQIRGNPDRNDLPLRRTKSVNPPNENEKYAGMIRMDRSENKKVRK